MIRYQPFQTRKTSTLCSPPLKRDDGTEKIKKRKRTHRKNVDVKMAYKESTNKEKRVKKRQENVCFDKERKIRSKRTAKN